jgi:hypothetical protein
MYALFGLERGGFSGKYNDFLALVDSSDCARLTQEIAAGLDKGVEFGIFQNCRWQRAFGTPHAKL